MPSPTEGIDERLSRPTATATETAKSSFATTTLADKNNTNSQNPTIRYNITMNIVAISKNGTDLITQEQIRYSLIRGCLYSIPLYVSIGILDQTTIDTDVLEVEELYKVVFSTNVEVEMRLDRVDGLANTIDGQKSTEFIFMHEDSSKVLNNKFNQGAKVWGIKLDKYIKGDDNQLELAHLELRKKGLINVYSDTLEISQKHTKELTEAEPKYIANIDTAKKIKGKSKKGNYASSSEGDGDSEASKGTGSPKQIPFASKSELKALDVFFDTNWIIYSTSANVQILLGDVVEYKKEKYVVIEKVTVYIKTEYKTVFVLGEQKK